MSDQQLQEQPQVPRSQRRIREVFPFPTSGLHRVGEEVTNQPRCFLVPRLHETYALGEMLREEHVVRADNGMCYTDPEVARFGNTNAERSPTFGNCKCFRAGPIGDPCMECVHTPSYFLPVWSTFDFLFDAEGLAKLVGHRHVQWPVGARHTGWLGLPMHRPRDSQFIDLLTQAIVEYKCPPENNVPPVEREPIRREARTKVTNYLREARRVYRASYIPPAAPDSSDEDEGDSDSE